MGRPRKDEPRNRQVNIHLTEGEFVAVVSRASAAGVPPAEYGRRRVIGAAPAGEVVPTAVPVDRVLHIQLRRLGNLLNQLVRHLHQTGEVLPEAVALLRDIRSLLDRSGP